MNEYETIIVKLIRN